MSRSEVLDRLHTAASAFDESKHPRVPAAPGPNPRGGEWTKATTGAAAVSATQVRGDWVKEEAEKPAAVPPPPPPGGMIVAGPDGTVSIETPKGSDADAMFRDFKSRLDPSRAWKVWASPYGSVFVVNSRSGREPAVKKKLAALGATWSVVTLPKEED